MAGGVGELNVDASSISAYHCFFCSTLGQTDLINLKPDEIISFIQKYSTDNFAFVFCLIVDRLVVLYLVELHLVANIIFSHQNDNTA